MSFASLAMYDFAGLRPHWEALYREITASIPNAPKGLTWGKSAYDWHGEVFLSMTCGAPFRNDLAERLHLVGTFDFGVIPKAGYYDSVIIGQLPTDRPVILAVNDMGSQSGYHAVTRWLRQRGLAFEIILSGAHHNSMQMVATKDADIAGIDAVSFRFIQKLDAALRSIDIIGRSEASPGLPLVTQYPDLIPTLQAAIRAALPSQALGIKEMAVFHRDDYLAVENA